MTAWYVDNGPEQDVVVSSRIRLARNFQDIPFPGRMSEEQVKQVMEKAKHALLESNTHTAQLFQYIPMSDLDTVGRQVLVEKHLVSPNMLQNVHSRGVLLSKDENISIMLNEEDHLRVQCIFAGMQLDEAWDVANKIDNVLEQNIEYAYNEKYGYLTCCPTNAGTGLRASVMIHLPALSLSSHLTSLLVAVGKLGIAIRGLYGEGTEARGHFFQISNQVTLGMSEEETLENLKSIIRQIIEQERVARNKLFHEHRLRLEDRLYRSYGIFSNARIMCSEEFMKLLSDVRLGIDLGIINNISLKTINQLMVDTQPAGIMKRFGGSLNAEQRDIKRAEMIRAAVS